MQRINKTNATITDIDTLRIDVDNMLRNGITDQDCKILKNHIDGDETLKTIPFLTENTNHSMTETRRLKNVVIFFQTK